jgi:hypothetical protein
MGIFDEMIAFMCMESIKQPTIIVIPLGFQNVKNRCEIPIAIGRGISPCIRRSQYTKRFLKNVMLIF